MLNFVEIGDQHPLVHKCYFEWLPSRNRKKWRHFSNDNFSRTVSKGIAIYRLKCAHTLCTFTSSSISPSQSSGSSASRKSLDVGSADKLLEKKEQWKRTSAPGWNRATFPREPFTPGCPSMENWISFARWSIDASRICPRRENGSIGRRGVTSFDRRGFTPRTIIPRNSPPVARACDYISLRLRKGLRGGEGGGGIRGTWKFAQRRDAVDNFRGVPFLRLPTEHDNP